MSVRAAERDIREGRLHENKSVREGGNSDSSTQSDSHTGEGNDCGEWLDRLAVAAAVLVVGRHSHSGALNRPYALEDTRTQAPSPPHALPCTHSLPEAI